MRTVVLSASMILSEFLYHSTTVAGLPDVTHVTFAGGPVAPEKEISSTAIRSEMDAMCSHYSV